MLSHRLDLSLKLPKPPSRLFLSLEKPSSSCSFKTQNPKPPSFSLLAKRNLPELHEDQKPRPAKRKKLAADERESVDLVNSLTSCVDSIRTANLEATISSLTQLGQLASPSGSTLRRLAAYVTEALAHRAAVLWPHHVTLPRREKQIPSHFTLRALNAATPIPRFLHYVVNERLLRELRSADKIHVIDCHVDVLQWASFLQSLASRSPPPLHVRLTAIGERKHHLLEVGSQLAVIAETLNLPFEFHPVVDRLEDVRLWMLHVSPNESIAVNCSLQLHKLLFKERDKLGDFLSLVRSLNPTMVLMAEHEDDNGNHYWISRTVRVLEYYSAVFDMVDSSMPMESLMREKVEEMFGEEMREIVSGEGRHVGFSKWREIMEERGFRSVGMEEREMDLGRMIVRMYDKGSYRVEMKDGAGLTLGWRGQDLYTLSAWR